MHQENAPMTNIFGHSVRWELLFLCIIEAITYFCAVAVLFILWGPGIGNEKALAFSALLALSCALIAGASGLYQPETWARVQRLVVRTGVAGTLLLLAWPVFRAMGPDSLDEYRIEVLLGFAAIVLGTRLAFVVAARYGLLRHRIITIPNSLAPAMGAPARRTDPPGPPGQAMEDMFEVVTALDSSGGLSNALDPQRLRDQRVRAVVAADPSTIPQELRDRCAAHGVRVFSECEFREQRLARVDIDSLAPDWLRNARALRAGRLETGAHRLLDLVAGIVLLAITLPLLLVTALAIKLDSRGPVFYRQERVGRNGRTFMLVKFRSMRVDAEAGGRPVWASQQDPRVTRVGRIIRRARIDEIPQVFNVLRGDMAFVGPRPERPEFVQELGRQIPHYDDRAVVKPGITGWAQVNYPYGASVEDARVKLSYDLYYVRRRSLFLDLLILIATVRVVLFQEGSR
ncbi:MAG: exopolysaccharide biosynthesis polyprenyl glycosylphosphotransferase [Acetobacteraceae bacterium]|nr:exopolysaccharide biosynthesis polyprenyl glycosylphosphotransferase [Acetobacteraceae bacterium]